MTVHGGREMTGVVLVTRPAEQAAATADAIAARYGPKWRAEIAPLLRIRRLGRAPTLPNDAALVFTSANGVLAWQQGGGRWHPAFVAGEATARAGRAAGLSPMLLGMTAAEVSARLHDRRPPHPLLHIVGRHRALDLSAALSGVGLRVTTLPLYEQRATTLPATVLRALSAGQIGAVLLMSPRTAKIFAACVAGIALPPPLRLLCLSAAVAAPVRDLGVAIEVAHMPRQEALLSLLS